jgi:phage gp36-like protein
MYATTEALEKRMKREYTAIYADDSGVVQEQLVLDDLAAAAAEIDGRMAVRYTVPVTASGALLLLENWNVILAMELAFARSESVEIPKKIKSLADNVRKQLEAVADGSLKLPASPAENSSGVGSVAIVSASAPVFTREKMSGF